MIKQRGIVVLVAFSLLALAVGPAAAPVAAEIAVRPVVPRAQVGAPQAAPATELAALDLAALAAEDAASEALGRPPRIAVGHPVFITPASTGGWQRLDADTLLWRYRVHAARAAHLSFGFERFHLPPGGRLLVYAADESSFIRPFTAADNSTEGKLWTPVLLTDEAILEVTVPEAEVAALELELAVINQGYRGFGSGGPGTGAPGLSPKSGSCNLDVVCPAGDPYRDIIRSVARITIQVPQGLALCSGAMINNTAQNLRPLFLTANHCGVTPSRQGSVVTYWNFQNSTCRTPGSAASGGPGNGGLSQFLSGSRLLATGAASDFTLLELNQSPNPAWRVLWAGWDRSSANPSRAVAVHHPQGEEKRISFENDPLTTTSYLGNSSPGDGTHLRVADWDRGTTEGGSSGSPLFNASKRIVGQLHGGFAACGNNDPDWYGRLSRSWDGGSAASRLRDWLDPLGSGAVSVGGIDEVPSVPVPVAPTSLVAIAQSPTDVLLTWDDNASNETEYQVEVSMGGGPFSVAGPAPADATSATVIGLQPSTNYSFRVRARNSGGFSPYSNVAAVRTLDLQPAAPTGLAAEARSATQVLVTWEDEANNETAFVIEARTVARANAMGGADFVGSAFSQVATAAANASGILVSGLDPDTTYNFRVSSENGAGRSEPTPEVAATTWSDSPATACEERPLNLCLLGGHFQVRAFWRNQRTGDTGDGTAVAGSDQTGYFWFFNRSSLELVVKMVDGTRLTGSFWVFSGSLTDLEHWIVVTDTATGGTWSYYNRTGNICGTADTGALPATGPSLTAPGGLVSRGAVAAFPTGAAPASGTVTEGACEPGPETLCLLGGRFQVEVEWRNHRPPLNSGVGGAIPADAGDATGFFWFFNAQAVELIVKMIDGTRFNGNFWVFYGALSDVEYTITVTDTETGATATYRNPPGEVCGGADTDALEG